MSPGIAPLPRCRLKGLPTPAAYIVPLPLPEPPYILVLIRLRIPRLLRAAGRPRLDLLALYLLRGLFLLPSRF
jgi:hypothetical protein